MNRIYDYVIVGAGLFGSVFARQMTNAGAKCLVIEKRNHIGGNCYTENINGIHVHLYGPHIFHTNSTKIWQYVNQYACFNRFSYRPKVNYKNNFYSFPINLNTLYQFWGVRNPQEAKKRIELERIKIDHPTNLEEWALSQVGQQLYETFIYGYTKKQWGREPKELPSSIIRRLPVRLTWNDDYFNDRYCGIPEGGYTLLFDNLLSGIDVQTQTDFLANRSHYESICNKILYTGPLDNLFQYEFGANDWRGLKFKHEILSEKDHQGIAAINYTDINIPYTRTIEHKHFNLIDCDHTVITHEYPSDWNIGDEMYYPVNNDTNSSLQAKYVSKLPKNYLIGGRLATYLYHDMHHIVASAIHLANTQCK